MPITAEGVEDEVTAIELTRLGCSKGQGWHFGRAASAADTDRLPAERGLLRATMVPPVGPATSEDKPRRHRACPVAPAGGLPSPEREGPRPPRQAPRAYRRTCPGPRG